MQQRFHDKSIIVTGAAGGIGLAAARAFAAEGGRVLLADINGPGVDAAAASIRAAGGTALSCGTDITSPAQCEAMVQRALEEFGGLHVAVNNAGIPSDMSVAFEDLAVEDWRRLIDTNLSGVFYCMKAEVPALKASGGGAIVNTASVASFVAAPNMAAYVASKHGVAGLTRAAALDLIGQGIRVNAVCPGMIRTPMTEPIMDDADLMRMFEDGIPARRIGTAEEVAAAILFLASGEASYTIGTLFNIDGGVLLR